MTINDIIGFAKKNGYKSAIPVEGWKGYDVYEPVYSNKVSFVGLPFLILVKSETIRMSTPEESFSYIDEVAAPANQ